MASVTSPSRPSPDADWTSIVGVMRKFGQSMDVDLNVFEDIWDGGLDYIWQPSAVTCEMVCAEGADTAAGTGVQKVRILGISTGGVLATEEKATDGGTSDLANKYSSIFRGYATDVGTGEVNAGDITFRVKGGDQDPLGIIRAGNGQTLMAVFTMPLAHHGWLTSWTGATNEKVAVGLDLQLLTKIDGESWRVRDSCGVNSQGGNIAQVAMACAIYIPPLCRVRIQGSSSANDKKVSAGFVIEVHATG